MPRKPQQPSLIADVTLQPVFASIRDWCVLSGMSPSRTYEALGRGDLRAKKLDKQTLVDVAHGLQWLRSLPDAKIYTKARYSAATAAAA